MVSATYLRTYRRQRPSLTFHLLSYYCGELKKRCALHYVLRSPRRRLYRNLPMILPTNPPATDNNAASSPNHASIA